MRQGGICGGGLRVGEGIMWDGASVGEGPTWGRGAHWAQGPGAVGASRSWDPSEGLRGADSDLPPFYCLFKTILLINNIH